MAQESTYTREFINGRPPELTDAGWWADIQFDPSDAKPIYIGLHKLKGVSDSDSGWKIYKFTYSGDDTTRIQLAYGQWTLRTSLF